MFSLLLAGCDLLENNKYKDFEMINTKDPINERALIEQTMSKQRELLKPGFINEQSNWENGCIKILVVLPFPSRKGCNIFNSDLKYRSEERRVGKGCRYCRGRSDE